MDSLKEFEAILTDPGLIHYAYRMSSKENFDAGIFENFEDDAFPNSEGGGNLNSIAAITCNDGHYWLIASIPIRDTACMEALAKKNGLIITDSTHVP